MSISVSLTKWSDLLQNWYLGVYGVVDHESLIGFHQFSMTYLGNFEVIFFKIGI